MARSDAQQALVTDTLTAYLREALTLDENQCFETILPPQKIVELEVIPGGDYFVTVAMGPGQFDEGLQIGGGRNQLNEECELIVTAYSRVLLDREGRDVSMIREASRGVYSLKSKLLSAFAQRDIEIPEETQASTFLRQFLCVVASDQPQYATEQRMGWVSIYIKVSWDWTLGE